MMRYAEEANYFTTTVHPAQSMGEIQAMLDDFGATSVQTATGNENGKSVWMIRFKWMDQFYRFSFTPLICKDPEKTITLSGKKRTALEQSKYQMGRIAFFAVKAVLTAAEAMPAVLLGFAELNAVNSSGLPITIAEVDLPGLNSILPELSHRGLMDGKNG